MYHQVGLFPLTFEKPWFVNGPACRAQGSVPPPTPPRRAATALRR